MSRKYKDGVWHQALRDAIWHCVHRPSLEWRIWRARRKRVVDALDAMGAELDRLP